MQIAVSGWGMRGFQDRLKNTCRRVWTVYRCQRQRNKNFIEIALEATAKLALDKPLPSALLKLFSRPYQKVTDRTLADVLNDPSSVEQILRREKLSNAKFFGDLTSNSTWQDYRDRFPGKCQSVVEEADKIVRHEFDLLGSGSRSWGAAIDWHVDPKTGFRWPKEFYTEFSSVAMSTHHADVKLPWELSRMQHLPTLGRAYRLTGKELYARELVAQITHWLDDNPYLVGVNWTCAMEVAIRIVNIVWGIAFIEGSSYLTTGFKRRLLVSILQHGQYLVRHLEFSIRPDGKISNHNHYLSDIVGLVYLGLLFPEFKAAETWRRIGLEGLVEEMERQVYSDGVDYESSISYHRLVVELFTSAALLCRLNDVQLPQRFWQRLEQMYAFSLYATRPDGKAPQIGDADDGRLHILSDYGRWDRTDHRYLLSIGAVLFSRPEMKAAAGAFSEEAFWLLGNEGVKRFDELENFTHGLGSQAFQEAGFYVMRSGENYLIACCNPVGTAGAGNHKHNDLLSFELFMGNRSFIVDPGTYIYTADPEWRNRFRSTAFHNTVVIDGEEQNRFKQKRVFSLVAESQPIIHRWCSNEERDWLDAEHTGYQRLSRPVSHRRVFSFDKRANKLEVTDTLQGAGEHTAEWYFHFDHGVDIEQASDDQFVAHADGATLQMRIISTHPFHAGIEKSWVSRRYGKKLAAKTLKLQSKFSDHCEMILRAHCAIDSSYV